MNHTDYYSPGKDHFSLLSHHIMLAGSRQLFHLHTLLMPKALTDKAYRSISICGLSQCWACLESRGFCFLQKSGHPGSYLHGRSSASAEWRVVWVLRILELGHQWWKRREPHEHPIKEWEPVLILPICKWQTNNCHEGHIRNRWHFLLFCACLHCSSYYIDK